MRRRGGSPLIALAAVVLGACGSGEAASPRESPSTVGNVGNLPPELPPDLTVLSPPTSDAEVSPYVTTDEGGDGDGGLSTLPSRVVGDVTDGNRLFVLGDSILEATTTTYGGEMCEQLVPHGWAVEIDAENGRDAGAGVDVLEDRLADGEEWDAAVVMLGNNYRHDVEQYDEQLGRVLDLLSPSPVVLLTVKEFESDRAEVNDMIRAEAAERPNVRVLEWAERSGHDESLTGSDGLHLSEDGKVALVSMVRLALGDAPAGSVGDCVDG